MIDIETMGTAHRPWPPPNAPWVMYQRWENLLFLHWPLSPKLLRDLVPPSLTLDTYGGQAWITITPLLMNDVRLRLTPAIPGISKFPELNVRTYVSVAGAPGVYFFSLDAASAIAVEVARLWFHLPYYQAEMTIRELNDGVHYRSVRTHTNAAPAEFVAHYAPTGAPFHCEPNTREHFLTERYCLYATDAEHRIYRTDIHHRPWMLQEASCEIEVNAMLDQLGIATPNVAPLLYFAKEMDVVAWLPKMLFEGTPG
jgi:uncharacterized protein